MVSSEAILSLAKKERRGTQQSNAKASESLAAGSPERHGTKRKANDAAAQLLTQPRTSWFSWLGFGRREEDRSDDATLCLDVGEIQRLISSARASGLCERKADALLQKLDGGILEVGIVGLLKAGKTTLMNCFIGQETLPSSSQPETACLVDVVHDPTCKNGKLFSPDGTILQEGHSEIRERIHQLNEKRRSSVSEGEGVGHIDRLEVRTSLGLRACCPGIEHVRLVDTPGPNETGAGLWHEVIDALLRVDAIIYVLDFTRIGTTDEAVMFEALKTHVVELLTSTGGEMQQMFFVLNKVDMRSSRNDKSLEEIMDYVAKKLNPMLPCKITSEQVLPLIAEDALLARQVKSANCKPAGALLEDFMRRNGHRLDAPGGVLAPSVRHCRRMAETMERHSLIHDIEKKVLVEVARKKTLLSATSVCQRLLRELQLIDNAARVQQSAAEASCAELQKKVSEMDGTVQEIERRLENLPADARDLCIKVRRRAEDMFSSIASDILATADVLFQNEAATLQADSIEALAAKADKLSRQLKQLVQLKWNHHRTLLMKDMCAQKREVRTEIAAMAQPILEAAVLGAERVLDTSLLLEEVVLEEVEFAAFEDEVRDDIATFARSENRAVQKKGLCTEEWTQVPVLTVDKADLQRQWMAKIQGLVDVSRARTVDLVHANVHREVQKVVNHIRTRCEDFVRTLKDEQQIRSQSTADASVRISEAQSQLKDVVLLKHQVQAVLTSSL